MTVCAPARECAEKADEGRAYSKEIESLKSDKAALQNQVQALEDKVKMLNEKMLMEIRAKVAEAQVHFLTTGRIALPPSAAGASGAGPTPQPPPTPVPFSMGGAAAQ